MEAAALGQDLFAGELARDQCAAVPDDGGVGKPGNATVGNGPRVGEPLGQEAEPRSEHDGDLGTAAAQPLPNGGNRCIQLAQSSIPAIVAERKFASIPAIIARSPSLARSRL